MKFSKRSVVTALFAILLFGVVNIAAFGQGIITGSVSGTVQDTSGAVVPNAKINIKNLSTGAALASVARQDGTFSFHDVPIGAYTLTITAPGFKALKIGNVRVTTGNNSALGVETLQVGQSSTTVQVEANSLAQLDTTQSQVSSTFNSEQLQHLPLNNGFDEVALLVPGVAPTRDAAFSNSSGASFGSNGERGRSNNFELDGQSNNDNSVAGPQIFFGNQDAIAEVQVIQSNFGAEYGRNLGTVVNYITKSGTNQFHGTGFELYTGSWLSALANQSKSPLFGYCASGQNPASTGCFTPTVPRYVDNKWGATLGGPILKNKLWFFGSTYFDHTRTSGSPSSSGSNLTPTPTGLQQLAAAFPGNPAVAILQNDGPFSIKLGNPQVVPGTVQNVTVTGPNGQPVTVQESAITRTVASPYNDQEDMGRLDAQPTAHDRLFLRYFYQDDASTNIADGGAGGNFYNVPNKNYSVGADWTHTFGIAWISQLRYDFQESKLDFQAGSYPNCTVNTLTQCPGNISFAGNQVGFGEATNLPQGRTVKVTQVQSNTTWSHGRQTIEFGGEYDYQNSPNVFLPLYNGQASFGTLNSFIHQNGNFSLATGNPLLPFTESDWALYLQDDYHPTPTLTLNMGLRWEFFGQAVNELHKLTVARESNPATAIWNTTLPLADRTAPSVASDYHNFEPRLGFAWNPDFDKKLVVRGAYSINVDPAFYNIFLNDATVAPVATSAQFACNGNCLGNGDFSGAGLRATNLSSLPIGGNPANSDQEYVPHNFHNPYGQTYSLGIEHQLGHHMVASIRYVGNHTIGNFQSVDANPYLLPVQQAFPKFAATTLCSDSTAAGYGRPNCNLGNQSIIGNYAFSIYNSLQSEITMQSFHGLTGTLSYTYSSTIDNSSEIFSTGAGGSTISVAQNPLNTDVGERGPSATDMPNIFDASVSYVIPKFNFGKSFLNRALNGFNINGIYQYTSGQPYNAYQPLLNLYGLDPSYCDTIFNESTVGPGADTCRLVLSNKNAPLNSVAILQGGASYDLGSYLYGTPTPLATSAAHWVIDNVDIANQLNNPYPGSGRNILRAQTYSNLDASIFKDTKITNRVTFELQMNVYNVLNVQFRGTPSANVFNDNPTAPLNQFLSNAYNTSGTSNSAAGNRSVQIGGKFIF